MATYSAQILIGRGHSNDGGISHGYKRLELAEGDSVTWIANKNGRRYVWLPRDVNTVLEDGLLMVATLYMKNSPIGQALASSLLDEGDCSSFSRISLRDYADIDFTTTFEQLRAELNTDTQRQQQLKLIFTIFNGSILSRQLDQISSLGCDVEILTTSYLKEYSPWSNKQVNSHPEFNAL
jgi:hypothetical protein